MDCKRLKILDGILDISLRVLFILFVYKNMMEKERIVVYDYMSRDSICSLNNQLTYIGLEKTINNSLYLLLSKQLIICRISNNENLYLLSEIGFALVTELLSEDYAKKICSAIEKTDSILHDINREELTSYINSQI